MSNDEQGIVIAAAVAPDDAMLAPKGTELVGLSTEAATRSFLELGTAATIDMGTSGATIPLLNGNNAYSGKATFSADATFNGGLVVGAPFILGSETLAIDSNGQLTPTKSNVLVNTFNSALNDLENIAVTNHPFGSVVKVKTNTSGQVPTIKHAVGNIYLDENVDAVLDDVDKSIWLELRDAADGTHNTGWYEVGRSWRVFPTNSLVQIATETTTTEFTI